MVFYRSFASAIKKLPDEFQLSALWAIIDYGLDGKEPSDNGIAEAIFSMAKPQIDANNKRYNNGLKGGRLKQGESKTEPNSNQKEPNNNQTKTKQSFSETKLEPNEKEKENVNVKDKEKEIKRKRFTPPTTQEVEAYCLEKGYTIDADRFIDFYESKGWMIGKNQMKDWKAAVRNWNRGQRQGLTAESKAPDSRNRFNNFNQRSYDFNDLEKKLLDIDGRNDRELDG